MNCFFQYSRIVLILLCCAGLEMSFAQKKSTKSNLQAQAKKLESQIRYNNKLLDETSKSKVANLNQLSILNDQIHKRDKLIKTIHTEISAVNTDIQSYENRIMTLEQDIKALKNEYAKLLVATQRHLNPSVKLMFIVASESFNQAYRRLKYFQQYSAHRKEQVALIRRKQEELHQTKLNLEQEKQSKTQLLSKEEQEKKQLDAEKTKKNQTVSELQKKEKQLRAEIAKNQLAAKKLSQQIEKIIAQEIEAAKKAAAKKAAANAAKKGTSATTGSTNKTATASAALNVSALTPEQKKLSDDFVSNRGKLPWPTERGVITEYFGTHEHPTLKNIKINNDGIDITTGQEEPVRTVFKGVVTTVFASPYGDAKTIIISHGNYRTVYSNVKSVSVKQGQEVNTKQSIGIVSTYDERNVLKFQLWKDMQKLNPTQWISSK